MPNWMSDEERGLSDGDLWQCEHCGKVMSVDESFHSCAEGAEKAVKSAKKFHKDYFGDETLKTRQFLVTIVAPDTDMAFKDAWDSVGTWGPEDTEGSDDILKHAWSIEEIT